MLHIIFFSLLVGILVSAPMGPIGMLIIKRTLTSGRRSAFYTGIGAGLSDLVYCLLAGLGISYVIDFMFLHKQLIQLSGGLFLALFGIWLFFKNPQIGLKKAGKISRSKSLFNDFASGFFLTFSNPFNLFFIMGLFGQFDIFSNEYLFYHYILAFIAIFIGALIWWYIVTYIVDKLRKKFKVQNLSIINKIVGSILLVIAIAGIANAIYNYYINNSPL